MLSQLVVLSLASAIGWELIRYFCPVTIPDRIAPVVVIMISFLMSICFDSSPAIICFAAAGGVAIFHKIVDAYTPPALNIRTLLIRKKRSASKAIDRTFPRNFNLRDY